MVSVSDYMKQVNQYDSGKPNTAVPSRGKTGTVIAPAATKQRPYAPEARPAAPVVQKNTQPVDLFSNYSEFENKKTIGGSASAVVSPVGTTSLSASNPKASLFAAASADIASQGQSKPFAGPGQQSPFQSAPSANLAFAESSLRGSAMRPTGGTPLLSQDATGRVGWFGADGRPAQSVFDAAPGLPAGSALASSSNNYTSRFQADSDIFKAQVAALDRGEPIGPMYTPQGQPGPGTYQQDSFMDRLSSQRDLLSKKVASMNASSGLSESSSIGDIISQQMKTKNLRDEIKSIDTQLLGRSELANKIQLAILQNLGAQTVQGMKESGDDRRAVAENRSLFDVHSMREKMETGRSVMDNMSAERIAAGRLAADDAAAKQKAGEKNTDFVNGINKDAMMKIIEANIPKDGGAVDPKSIAELTRKTYSAFYPDTEKKDELTKGIL